MRECALCRQPDPTPDQARRARRRQVIAQSLALVAAVSAGVLLGYGTRDWQGAKREVSVLRTMLDTSMRLLQVERLVQQNEDLRGKVRKASARRTDERNDFR